MNNYDGNIALWQEIAKGWTEGELKTVLYSSSRSARINVWGRKDPKVDKAMNSYIEFAHKCSDAFRERRKRSWGYNDLRNSDEPNYDVLLREANDLYAKEKNAQLKSRYAYQLIRIFHYAGKRQEAIDFFESKVKNQSEKNEIYYYTLDQVAGCYYGLNNFEQAAYYYIQVFENSQDRKTSAFVSYDFCTNKGAEGKTLFENREEEGTYLLLRSLQSFSDVKADLAALNKFEPGGKKVELLFMRTFNDVERKLLPKHIGLQEKTLPANDEKEKEKARFLLSIAEDLSQDPSIENSDFWHLSISYLNFLLGETTKAKARLEKVEDSRFAEQKQQLKEVYKVFSWTNISEEEELYLMDQIGEILNPKYDEWSYDSNFQPSWKFLLIEQVGHLYYKNGQLAKAFLIHNQLEKVRGLEDLFLIDALSEFIDKPNKNAFEERLLLNSVEKHEYPQRVLKSIKANHYLQLGENELAMDLYEDLKKEPARWTNYSAKIFSNNTREWFNGIEDSVMLDSVYLANLFDFIKPEFNKIELTKTLIKLDSLAQEEIEWKRKIAHYLLGNYYFNVSNTGYYRNVLSHVENNCCSYNYFAYPVRMSEFGPELMKKGQGFNLYQAAAYRSSYRALAKKSLEHYEQVLANSADAELNARTLYMMSKAELNLYYNESFYQDGYDGYDEYDGTLRMGADQYKNNFKKLKEQYLDTKFGQMILKECSFFRYYCSL